MIRERDVAAFASRARVDFSISIVDNLDLELHQQQLQADVDRLEATVDRLEATDYAAEGAEQSESEWRPDTLARRRLLAATTPSYATRMTTASEPLQAEEPRPQATYHRTQRTNLQWQSPECLQRTHRPAPSLLSKRHPATRGDFLG